MNDSNEPTFDPIAIETPDEDALDLQAWKAIEAVAAAGGSVAEMEAAAHRALLRKHQIVVKRGTLGGGPWGFDVTLDGERIAHTGTLTDAEAFADGCACGIVALGGDAEISREQAGLTQGLQEERVARMARHTD